MTKIAAHILLFVPEIVFALPNLVLLPTSSAEWHCVKDYKSGLVWGVVTESGLTARDVTYTETQAIEYSKRANTANMNNGVMRFCGLTKWRLPPLLEKQGLA